MKRLRDTLCSAGRHKWGRRGQLFEHYGAIFVRETCVRCGATRDRWVTNR